MSTITKPFIHFDVLKNHPQAVEVRHKISNTIFELLVELSCFDTRECLCVF